MLHRYIILAATICLAHSAAAQGSMSMSMPMHDMAPPSAKAQQQLAEVTKAIGPLRSETNAQKAGFHPVFGWIPTMGEHWVDSARMSSKKFFDMDHPNNLMFSSINGHDSLVGAAYAFFAPIGDTTRPANTFDGNPPWHEHSNLAPAGQTLVMLHVWFVPSPDGPFAGHNPNLPYWAVGLVPPDLARWHDHSAEERLHLTAMAFAEIADSAGFFPTLNARPALHARLVVWRAQIRAIIPELASAQKAGDWAKWDKAADKEVAIWKQVRQAYIDAAITADGKARVLRFLEEEETGMHGMEHT